MERSLGILAGRVNSEGKGTRIAAGIFKSLLFLSAYSPLGIILAIVVWKDSYIYSIILVGVSILSVLLLWRLLRSLKSSAAPWTPIDQIQRRDEQILSYIVTYAIPFLAVPFESIGLAVGLVVFFVLIWFLQVRLNLLYINPALSLLGFHLYEVTTADVTKMLLSKRRLGPDSVLYAAKVGDTILRDKHDDEG